MKYFFLALLIPFTFFAEAQSGKGSSNGTELKNVEKYSKFKWRRKLKIARAKMKTGSYYNAAQYLEDVYKDKPTKLEVTHLLGEANRYLRDYEAAEKYYKATVTKEPEAYVSDQFHLGVMQKMNGRYEDAKKTFEGYLKAKLLKGDENLKGLAKIEIEGCDSALVITKNPSKIKVEKTEGVVNTTLQEYSPKPLKDNRILFASQRTDTAVNLSKATNAHNVYLFTAEKSGGKFINRYEFPSPPNNADANTNNAVFSGDEKTLIFTRFSDTLGLGNMLRSKLYRTTRKNATEWTEPEDLKALNMEGTTTTQPTFGVDAESNDIVYFVSNRKGGKGGLDIYYARAFSDGTFGAVQNAGDAINTPGDEMTPYYDRKNKVFYFSSNGHASIGGLDVFKTAGVPGKWGPVVNAGVPINSSADDLYLTLDERGARGFMVSNRVGTTSPRGATCCDDVWTVIVQRDITLKGIYVKRGDPTNTPIVGVDASMYKAVGNGFDFVQNAITTPNPFLFPVKRNTAYKINGTKDGYWPSIDNVSISEDEERDTIEKIFYLDPIIKIHIKIPNVYFAFDKSNVIDFYKGQIDSVVNVLNAHPGYSVEIQGHTDSKGSDEYNEKLSQKRANEVKTFLIKKKGIAENRVVTKWFGEKMPAVPNELPNGEDDPEGRARNRRVEFKIITDKPDDAPEFESYGEVVKEVKTGPGYRGKTSKKK